MDCLAPLGSNGEAVSVHITGVGEDMGASSNTLSAPRVNVLPKQTLEFQPDR